MSVKIVKYNDEYLEKLLSFFKEYSPDHPELYDENILKWQRGQRFLALMGDKIVGHITLMPHPFHLNNNEVELGWIATLVLDNTNPMTQVFAGTTLLNQVTGDNNKNMAAVGVVPEIENTHKRRGYVINRSDVNMYARFFNPSQALKFLGKSSLFSVPVLAGNILFAASKSFNKQNIKPVTNFDSTWDSIWERFLSVNYKFYGKRNSDYLNYKINQPGKKYLSYLYMDNNKEIAGYIVIRIAVNEIKKIKLLKVCDLVGSKNARQSLLSFAVNYARQNSVDGIIALSSENDKKIYKKAGLWISKNYPVVKPTSISDNIQISFFESDLDHLW